MIRYLPVLLSMLVMLFASHSALAAWPHDPSVNRPVTTGTLSQYLLGSGRTEAVPDGQGGLICFWDAWSLSGVDDIRAQRFDASGNRLWGDLGVQIVAGTAIAQFAMCAIPDGSGGAIVAWQDPRYLTQDVFAQRIDSGGNVLWGTGGVAVCTAFGDQTDVRLTSDRSGGAWVVWTDARDGASTDIYARRVSSAGIAQGVANGIAVCSATGIQNSPRVTSMPAGMYGCTIVWKDERIDGGDIYGQRLDNNGNPAWAANGLAICSAVNTQLTPELVDDGSSGVVVAWSDNRSGTDLYAQRLNSGGSRFWTDDGVVVCAASGGQYTPALALDGAGGVVIAFLDYRNLSADIYAQRLSLEVGAPVWIADGIPVCSELGAQSAPLVVADGTGGTYMAWLDRRLNDLGDIYAQRLSNIGYLQWPSAGVAVAAGPGFEYGHTLVSAGAEGCLLLLAHATYGGASFAAAQKVDRWGYLGAEPALVSVTDVPSDQGGQVKVSWLASPLDTDPLFGVVSDYLVFRSVPAVVAREALALGQVTDSALETASPPANGRRRLLRVVSPAGVASFWESVAQQSAQHLDSYSAVVATTADSVPGSNPYTQFMVQARNWSAGWWNSDSLSGYSVDNLVPAQPAPFTGQYVAGTTFLHWNRNTEADLAGYRLYRGSSAGFVPGPGNLVATPSETDYADAAGAPHFYKLTAVDAHGNESPVATLLPDGTLDVGTTPVPVERKMPRYFDV